MDSFFPCILFASFCVTREWSFLSSFPWISVSLAIFLSLALSYFLAPQPSRNFKCTWWRLGMLWSVSPQLSSFTPNIKQLLPYNWRSVFNVREISFSYSVLYSLFWLQLPHILGKLSTLEKFLKPLQLHLQLSLHWGKAQCTSGDSLLVILFCSQPSTYCPEYSVKVCGNEFVSGWRLIPWLTIVTLMYDTSTYVPYVTVKSSSAFSLSPSVKNSSFFWWSFRDDSS